MNLMPLVELLAGAGFGVKGENIFLNMMPIGAEDGILLRSPLQGTPIDYELPGYFRASFQLIVRGRDYGVVEARTRSAVDTLTLAEMPLDTVHFIYSRPRTEPVSFPLSKGNLLEFSVEFSCRYRNLT